MSAAARDWLRDLSREDRGRRSLFLVACKCDSISDRVVSQDVAQALADEFATFYYETSAIQGWGVDEFFEAVLRDIVRADNDRPTPMPINPNIEQGLGLGPQ